MEKISICSYWIAIVIGIFIGNLSSMLLANTKEKPVLHQILRGVLFAVLTICITLGFASVFAFIFVD